MAIGQSKEVLDIGFFVAAADLSAKQFYAVEQSSATQVNIPDATTDNIVGILQNKPKSGEAANVRTLGVSMAVTDGNASAIAVGDLLKFTTAGKLVKATADAEKVVGRALEASTTDGAIIAVQLTIGAQRSS